MWVPTLPLVVWLMHLASMPLMVINLLPSRTVQQKQKVEHRFKSGSMDGQQPYWRAIQMQPQNALQVYNWYNNQLIFLQVILRNRTNLQLMLMNGCPLLLLLKLLKSMGIFQSFLHKLARIMRGITHL